MGKSVSHCQLVSKFLTQRIDTNSVLRPLNNLKWHTLKHEPTFSFIRRSFCYFCCHSFYSYKLFFKLPEKTLPYIKKMYLMTPKERELFSILDKCVPNDYYIFPQIHIASIVEVKKGEPKWQRFFNKIISKSIDFVIFDKVNISPVLAIELDDYTHSYEKRIARDEFVNEAIKTSKIKMLRFENGDLSNPTDIKNKVLEQLNTNITV